MVYNGFYIYNDEKTPIVINNDGDILSFKMYGTTFSGTEFSSFSVAKDFTEEIKQKCEFWKVNILNGTEVEFVLCDCIFEVYIPQVLIDSITNAEKQVLLRVDYALGKERSMPKRGLTMEGVKLSVVIDTIVYSGEGDLFEDTFDRLSQQLPKTYLFKNCYGCLFSDYSIYGQSSFGTMLCYVNNQLKYLEAKYKFEFEKLDNYSFVQEIYVCEKYKCRIKGTGYRG